MAYEVIELMESPSMPTPFSSTDPGEAWVWDDFVIILQTNPTILAETLSKMTNQKGINTHHLKYPYAMTVFYRKDRNPHGPSLRPILVATLEQMDYAAVAEMMDLQDFDVNSLGMQGEAQIVQGLFTAGGHFHLGNFEGTVTLNKVRSYFLNLIKSRLSLEDEPVKIGVIANIYGHPNTGWPVRENKRGSGCLAVSAMFLFLLISLIVTIV